ncbi:hypothetical protein NBRC116592_02340 [Colwellia sp. KU-HH00111]|uniref:Hpt domain-containing protein n=1 Tax=Colwellia sp. KU-HH00111 TaxID=3127652 RepID=UPI003101C249
MSENTDLIQLDTELLDSYIQSLGSVVVKQMFDLYCQQVVGYIEDIEHSLVHQNAKLWQENCHKMKGAAGSIGLKALHGRLKVMEKSTKDHADKAEQLTALKTHNSAAIADFEHWFTRL